jgi:hypothetical protein
MIRYRQHPPSPFPCMCERPHKPARQGSPQARCANNVRTVTRCGQTRSTAAAHSRPFALLTIREKRFAWHHGLARMMGRMMLKVALIGIIA